MSIKRKVDLIELEFSIWEHPVLIFISGATAGILFSLLMLLIFG